MTRSNQTGPDLFDSLGLVDAPLFDLDTDTAVIVAPEPTETDAAMLAAALTTGYYEPTAAEVEAHEAAEWTDTADQAEPVDPWEGATVLTVDADLNAVSYPYGDPSTAGAWLEVPQADADDAEDDDTEEDEPDDDSDERAPLAEREIRLTWTVTTRYEWSGLVEELPEQVRGALRLNGFNDVDFDDDADWGTVERFLPRGDEYDGDVEVDDVEEV